MPRESDEMYAAMVKIARREAMKLQAKTKMGTVDGSVADGIAKVVIDGNETSTDCATLVTAYPSDRVLVSFDPETGNPVVIGNKTNPSVNDSGYQHTKDIAEEANKLLAIISDAADKADTTTEDIFNKAVEAGTGVEQIKNYVGMAEEYDKTLTERVSDAEASASSASQSAASAASEAAAAAQSASSASTSAARAESGLARVQDVVGTVTWLEEHAGPTSDTEAVLGKDYYVYNEVTKTLTPADVQQGDSVAGLWELTESVRDYIASYLALVNGVLRLSNGGTARVELSSKALRFYSENNTVVAAIAVTDDDVSYLNVRKMKIERGMYFDQWRMFRRRNGNLALKWNKLFE